MEQMVPYPIPSDLLIDIILRVPAKSVARFRCVSKLWGSILRNPDFTELFLTKSSTRPRLFFTIQVKNEVFFFSSPQPQNPVESSSLVATRYNYFHKYFPSKISTPLCGLVFLRRMNEWICNPVTGESITLPKVIKATGIKEESYFGYDPISKQFKVLCMTWSRYGGPNTHWILTLGTGKRLWRTTMECKPHYARQGGICINGVLYYGAYVEDSYKIVCFDFRFEKFSFIKILDQEMRSVISDSQYSQCRVWSNYKGKLCAHHYDNSEELVLWVLEDVEKHKWSKSICVMSSLCYEIRRMLYIVGITGAGEIVFSPYGSMPFDEYNTFYLVFYNMERSTFARVNIQGLEDYYCYLCSVRISAFLDYVERI